MINFELIDRNYGPGCYLLINCEQKANIFFNSKAYLTKSIVCELIHNFNLEALGADSLLYDFIVFDKIKNFNELDLKLFFDEIKSVTTKNTKITFFLDADICQETKSDFIQRICEFGFVEDYSFPSNIEEHVKKFNMLNIVYHARPIDEVLPASFSNVELLKKIKFGECVKSYIRQNERLAIIGLEPHLAEDILIRHMPLNSCGLYSDASFFYHSHFEEKNKFSQKLNDSPCEKYDCIIIYGYSEEVPGDFFSRTEDILTPGGRLILMHPSIVDAFLNPSVFDIEAAYGCYEGFTAWSSINVEDECANIYNDSNYDYFIFCAMKNPFVDFEKFKYEEISYNYSYPPKNLLAFERDYINPWVVKSMVEFPFRNRRPAILKKYAHYILENYDNLSADYGAALAILGYQCMESEGVHNSSILGEIAKYCKGISALFDPSAHQTRWLVSLYVLLAELNKRDGHFEVALTFYNKTISVDFEKFSPTIGTKILQAYYNIAIMLFSKKDFVNAELYIVSGLIEGYKLLSASPEELYGDISSPLQFTLYIYHDILDWLIKLTNARNLLCEKSYLLVPFNNGTWSSLLNERLRAIQKMDLMVKERDDIIRAQAQLIEERWESMNIMEGLIKERDLYIHDLETAITELKSTNKPSNGER